MVDIYGRPFISIKSKTKTDIDISKYATKEEVDDLLNLAGVDPYEVAIFQDKQGKLKTSNIKWNDIVRRVLGATTGYFPEFTDRDNIRDSNISIKDINDKMTKSVADWLKTTGDTMTVELNLNGNKITVLRDPTSPEDAENKQYVDTGDTAKDNKLTALRSDYTTHVKKFQAANKCINDFFGERRARDINITLSEIKTKLNDIDTINTRLGVIEDSKSVSDFIAGLQTNINGIVRILNDISEGIPNIVTKTSMIQIPFGVASADIVNIGHTVSAGSATWSQQKNTIEHIAAVADIYRLSVFSAPNLKYLPHIPSFMILIIFLELCQWC